MADENGDALTSLTRPYSKVVATSRHWNSRSGCSLTTVVWPAAAISRAPTTAREDRRPTHGTPEEKEESSHLLRLLCPLCC